jgi:hypothetical protein
MPMIRVFVAWSVAHMSMVYDTEEYKNMSMVIGAIIKLSF